MSRTTKEYVLAAAKAQGKISKLIWYYGEGDYKRRQLEILMEEIESLKQEFLKDDLDLKTNISKIKQNQKFYLGSCYTDPFGWGFPPVGGWPASKGGMMHMNEDLTDQKKLPFGRSHIKVIPKRGESLPFEECWVSKKK